ncbi:amino acid/amide ABC transporter ATP-binding protein 1 (HAAT family) [Humitalea rosea]|uniref:Amino acid/amide ABC transporter ATP-binding protein 1 (HAAT family) n=1 Tax=Humitalea rosea TaxID=990373 RepID=A0A2W7IC15_9PROT|nr:ABC transporter ATP-binding protein [Humitalea rosea]PZW43638.1 amino acid/amide ABC transporter ATP-binding protein 1 (HAAT family) [Humitalea rosea]
MNDPDGAAQAPNPLLTVTNLRRRFGGLAALDGVSFSVAPGRITALIGPNGAGKTTLFNAVSGLLRVDAGSVRLRGRELLGLKPEAVTAQGLVRSFQIARGFPRLTVFEHLMLYGQRQPGERWTAALFGGAAPRRAEAALAERALAIAARLRLAHVIDNRVTALSGGQKKLLEIGRTLMAEPEVILLDEPAAGVNPTLAEEIGDALVAIAAEGRTILLIEHDMALVGRIAQDVVVMAAGRTLATGDFDSVCADPAVQDAYLGTRRAA